MPTAARTGEMDFKTVSVSLRRTAHVVLGLRKA
jgi:hypothetical protein